jgi:hypothetical protein
MKLATPIAKLLAGVLCMMLVAGPLLAVEKEKVPGKRWKLKYEAGSAPFVAGQSINVMVGREDILLLSGNSFGGASKEQSIPIEAITQITTDTARGRYASRALAGTVKDVQSSGDLVMYMYVMLPLAIATLPFKGTRHFVTIEWTEGRQHRAVVLRMKGLASRDFLLELAQAAGVTPRDLDRERAEFKKELQKKSAVLKQGQALPAAPSSN